MLDLLNNDPWLRPYEPQIQSRYLYTMKKLAELTNGNKMTLSDFASGHLYFGLHKDAEGWVLREWAPNATNIYLLGDCNDWRKQEKFKLIPLPNGVWEIRLPLSVLRHRMHYKLFVEWEGGCGERIPAWATYVVQDQETHLFTAVVWDPEIPFERKYKSPTPEKEPLLIYECHIGMASEEEKVATYREFKENILPMIAAKGYNAIQVMAIMEHPYYGSFGYQVSSFFAPSSRFGTPDELRELIDEAHRLGLLVIMDLVHSHAVKNETEGLARFDGSYSQYFHGDDRMKHPVWDSMCFDYGKNEVLHFLLSNCRYWLECFGFDGFRFDGVTSMLYHSHGLGQAFTSYRDYFNGGQDGDAIMYLTLANLLIHETNPQAITIAEDVSGMPGLAIPVKSGGYGFDYRLAMNIPDFWIKLIKEQPDEGWKPGSIWWECTNRRSDERTINYAESHDQALVGDKTILFRLVDQEMYWHMSKQDPNLTVERGMALHKMIRLVTLSTTNGGYLNFMGNEFGHPEWIDFPREGNSWSYKYARRQWSLSSNERLRYQELDAFDHDMLEVVKSCQDFQNLSLVQYWDQPEDQVLVYGRGEMLFVYNFHPVTSHADYRILVPVGEYEVILDSDRKKYGGYDRNDSQIHHFTQFSPDFAVDRKGWIQLYLPSRSCMVLRLAVDKKRNKNQH